ncbi:MAG: tyrosine--tRNA ligase [Clostridium sp.]|nr:tyrosine--tRNA ligase [Clostridium sp.]
MDEQEKEVENTLKILLKGVAEHTAVSDIRARLLKARRESRPLTVKLGLDPSAPDIHLGHSVVLRKIRQLQDLGQRAVIIIGDYTGRIGDPSGKSKTRRPMTEEEVLRNAQTYQDQIFKIIDPEKTEVRFNSEWLGKLLFSDVILLASKCTVARMLERDDFSNRYANHLPLSVHEFFYPLMQAYDSVAVKADIELGGTDQTFNILMGRNIQKDYGQEPQLTLFMPLLEGIDGVEKMSKSLGNYIGIDEEPHVIYDKVMRIPDPLILKYYNLCTDVHPDEVEKIAERLEKGENPRDVKMELAFEITRLYCGEPNALEARKRFIDVYQKNLVPDDVEILHLGKEGSLEERILSALMATGKFKSKNEIRRLTQQGGVRWNEERVTDLNRILLEGNENVLKAGKKQMFRIEG